MSIEREHGCWSAGTIGSAEHVGTPLTVDQIKALEPGTRIVVTWRGGNGPWEGHVEHDEYLGPVYVSERTVVGPLLAWPDEQTRPLNRVTLAIPPASSEQDQ